MPLTKMHGKSLIPDDGVEFELTLTTVPDPMEMLWSNGYDPNKWKHKGRRVKPETRRFMLVRVGYQPNLAAVQLTLGEDNVPEGQWREAFKEAFPENDGNGPIGFSDASWVGPNGLSYFPVLRECDHVWSEDFIWTGEESDNSCRWLTASK